ncbi:MAG: hypothetical protein Q4A83_04660 [Bacillota bacterium]|nr:hypothetical protein [Bacillota bacterium]
MNAMVCHVYSGVLQKALIILAIAAAVAKDTQRKHPAQQSLGRTV